MNPRTANLLQLNSAVLIWAGTSMFAKGIDLPVPIIICLRSVVAAVALLFYLRLTGRPTRVRGGKHYAVMVALGLLLAAHWLSFFHALRISSAAVAIVSLCTYPLLTSLLEPLFFKEKFHLTDLWIGIGALAGLAIMIPEFDLGNNTTQGVLWAVLSGVFFMGRNLLTRHFVQSYRSSTLMFWQTAVVGVALLPVLLLIDVEGGYDARSLGLLLLLGSVFTALPQTLFSSSMKHLSARTVGVLSMLQTVYGAVLGYLIHDERLDLRTAIGASIAMVFLLIETARAARAPLPPSPR